MAQRVCIYSTRVQVNFRSSFFPILSYSSGKITWRVESNTKSVSSELLKFDGCCRIAPMCGGSSRWDVVEGAHLVGEGVVALALRALEESVLGPRPTAPPAPPSHSVSRGSPEERVGVDCGGRIDRWKTASTAH